MNSELAQLRIDFTRTLAHFITRASEQGYELAFGEGYVALTDAADGDYDGPHKNGGAHYTGLGQDLVLYRGGVPVVNGDDGAWQTLGPMWRRMDDRARWGGTFGDANHFSFFYKGRS